MLSTTSILFYCCRNSSRMFLYILGRCRRYIAGILVTFATRIMKRIVDELAQPCVEQSFSHGVSELEELNFINKKGQNTTRSRIQEGLQKLEHSTAKIDWNSPVPSEYYRIYFDDEDDV
ncbi:hypothetical protein DICVIV_11925 [Dictyocaulus viviparus]|uniref:Uncharacterized protein n=1 Tax=Dictyocaulus viviparus TaxID=29172 RepID=A0A0D8XBU7_DICVI|nr:hypothetical protein DICVIV_11925 [Dictyocaulus viviparus]